MINISIKLYHIWNGWHWFEFEFLPRINLEVYAGICVWLRLQWFIFGVEISYDLNSKVDEDEAEDTDD